MVVVVVLVKPEILKCRKVTSTVTIHFLHVLFAKYGLPDWILSDNASQFTAREFRRFCKAFAIKHIATPACHPRNNGQQKSL